ncbi:class I SAM-dependent methyltransferase [Plantactinospora siamensis]|uniref:Class I SAM-dependent methyltransferase n=1 Tax=Plantactinospora siamensis TaxID=555372 RepID=A0ABV6NY69_9ACTN
MPTLPPEPASRPPAEPGPPAPPTLTRPAPPRPPAAEEPHRHRGMAESFGVDPARYDRARPGYPEALVRRIVAGSPGPDFLDVGCGTGTAARQFQAAGCTVLGVEPDPRMADFARRTGVPVEVGTFEDWNPAGRRFAAVVAGTAWHWIDPVAGAAKAARALRPGGRLTPFWHVFQPPAEVADAFIEAFQRVAPDSPLNVATMRSAVDAYQALLTRVADGIRAAGAFAEPERWRYDWTRAYTRDEWLDLLPTQGGLTRLPADRLGELLDAVGAAVDALGGTVLMSYATMAVSAVRTDAP